MLYIFNSHQPSYAFLKLVKNAMTNQKANEDHAEVTLNEFRFLMYIEIFSKN